MEASVLILGNDFKYFQISLIPDPKLFKLLVSTPDVVSYGANLQ